MKKSWIVTVFMVSNLALYSQDLPGLLAEGRKLEQRYKDEEALLKYKEALHIKPTDTETLLRCAEASIAVGLKYPNPDDRIKHYTTARQYAYQARQLDSTLSDAWYMESLAYSRLSETVYKPDEMVDAIKQCHILASKALAISSTHPKANHLMGKWNMEILTLPPVKRAALKLVYPLANQANIDNAIKHMELCKKAEPYYCANFYDLARAYEANRQYEKAIALLEELQKLPTRRSPELLYKAAGQKLLEKLK